MEKMEEFKIFAAQRPYLGNRVHAKLTTWQELYETYDIYGPEHQIFEENTPTEANKKTAEAEKEQVNASNNKINWAALINSLSSLDLQKVSDGLSTIKKVVDIFGNLNSQQQPTGNQNKRPFRRYND